MERARSDYLWRHWGSKGESWEGIFFSNKALTSKGKRMTTIERIYFSLNIFDQFFVIFND